MCVCEWGVVCVMRVSCMCRAALRAWVQAVVRAVLGALAPVTSGPRHVYIDTTHTHEHTHMRMSARARLVADALHAHGLPDLDHVVANDLDFLEVAAHLVVELRKPVGDPGVRVCEWGCVCARMCSFCKCALPPCDCACHASAAHVVAAR